LLGPTPRCRTHVKALSIVEGAFFYYPGKRKEFSMPKDSIDLDQLVSDLREAPANGRVNTELLNMGLSLGRSLNAELQAMMNDPGLAAQREIIRSKISRVSKAYEDHLHGRNKSMTKAYRDGTAPTKRPRKGRSVNGPQPRKKSKAK
jgi:hypothetical protein